MEPDMKEMEHIRRQGYTLVDCEEQSYKQEAACPIFDFYGDIMAALTFVSIKMEIRENWSEGSVFYDNLRNRSPSQCDRDKKTGEYSWQVGCCMKCAAACFLFTRKRNILDIYL